MNTSNDSRALALSAAMSREGTRRHRLAAAWASAPAFLRGRSGLLVLAVALVVLGLLAGWTWLGTAAVLPLLYILPCAAMMAMCMKGHGGASGKSTSEPGGASGDASGSPR